VRQKLVINQCPTHKWWSISVDYDSGGVRVTDGKCCGRWNVIHSFPMSPRLWKELAMLAEQAAEDTESAEDAEDDGQ